MAPERDVIETALLRASIDLGWPVIGVCRGMQAINVFHGGRIAPLGGHAGVRHSLTIVGSSALIANGLDSQVNSFHDFGIPADGLGKGLEVLAEVEGWPEAFVHRDYPHLGIMWHPERENPFSSHDLSLFRRFLRAV
jgi:putative glutamine amidotransferase